VLLFDADVGANKKRNYHPVVYGSSIGTVQRYLATFRLLRYYAIIHYYLYEGHRVNMLISVRIGRADAFSVGTALDSHLIEDIPSVDRWR
jgi:hypothetical protein